MEFNTLINLAYLIEFEFGISIHQILNLKTKIRQTMLHFLNHERHLT